MSGYCMTKAAVHMFTKRLCLGHIDVNIEVEYIVNMLLPKNQGKTVKFELLIFNSLY